MKFLFIKELVQNQTQKTPFPNVLQPNILDSQKFILTEST